MLEKINSPADLKKLSIDQLNALAGEIRSELISVVSETGGHLASNLGIVELTLALDTVFDCPADKILFDVGHQSYVHKILTGRREAFSTLRQKGGISGFPRMEESPYDAFGAGHASTAISAALGMARTRDLMGGKNHVVAVLGDGALTGGMCYEALNDAGQTNTPLIVILNDNEMSISPNVGALSAHLTRMRQSRAYRQMKKYVHKGLDWIPVVGKGVTHFMEWAHDAIKSIFIHNHFFDSLNIDYLGPVDGHDLKRLIVLLTRAKEATRPVVLHVVTRKGRGYLPAETRPGDFHGVAPFHIETGELKKPPVLSNGQVMAAELVRLAEQDCRIVAITAAMCGGTGLTQFRNRFPARTFDVGIAEEHAVTMAAGMAVTGMKPYVAIYSTFLQRAYDQIMMDVCANDAPVTLLLDRSGLNGSDGVTHQGVFDLSYLRAIPNLAVASPRDISQLRSMLRLSVRYNGPMAIRYARESDDMGPRMQENREIVLGTWEVMSTGKDVTILAVGGMVSNAMVAAIELLQSGIECGVVDARFIKPMDEKMLREIARSGRQIVTVEDNVLTGGFGEGVVMCLEEWGVHAPVLTLGVPDRFIAHASIAQQQEECGISAAGIARAIRRKFDEMGSQRENAKTRG